MKNKSSSSDSEGTRAAAAAAVASRSLSGTSRDASERLLSRPGAAAAASAAVTEKGRAVPAGGSFTSQGSAAASAASGLLAMPRPGAPIVVGVTATISQSASPKSSIGGRSVSSGSSGCALVAVSADCNIPWPGWPLSCIRALMAFAIHHTVNCGCAALSPMLSCLAKPWLLKHCWYRFGAHVDRHSPAGLFRRSGSPAETAGSPRRLLRPVAAFAARLRQSHQEPSADDVTTGSLSECAPLSLSHRSVFWQPP